VPLPQHWKKYFSAKTLSFLLNRKLLLSKTFRFEEMHFARFHQHCNSLSNRRTATPSNGCMLLQFVQCNHRRTRRRERQQPGLKIFRASASSSKILNDEKYIFSAVNSGRTLFFRASANCSKILNVKWIFNTVKNFRAHSVFQGKRKLPKNPESNKKI